MAGILNVVALLFAVGVAQAGQQALLEQLRVDHAALLAVERDYQRHREQGRLGAAEVADYADYLARLRERVAQDCLALARVDVPLPPELPCPAGSSTRIRSAPIDQATEQTRAERTLSLDAELSGGLGDFDELLLREQERVKAAAPRTDGGGADGSGRSGDGGDGSSGQQAGAGEGADSGRQADAGGDMTGSGDDQQGDGAMAGSPPSGARGGGGTTRGVGGQPPGIPDGSDDSLAARQLREMAEKETDPEKKKKYWEEYRRYKQGTR